MSKDTTVFVGLDVHKDSITGACIGSHPDEPVIDAGTVGTQQYAIDRLCKKLSGRGSLRFVYEAGPCGFWLQRYLAGKGYDCVVAAPSLIPKKPGDRIKTDRRDARNLALALRAGTLPAATVTQSSCSKNTTIPVAGKKRWPDILRIAEKTLQSGCR